MKNSKDYIIAIEKSKTNNNDVKSTKSDAVGSDALEFIDTFLTPEEIA